MKLTPAKNLPKSCYKLYARLRKIHLHKCWCCLYEMCVYICMSIWSWLLLKLSRNPTTNWVCKSSQDSPAPIFVLSVWDMCLCIHVCEYMKLTFVKNLSKSYYELSVQEFARFTCTNVCMRWECMYIYVCEYLKPTTPKKLPHSYYYLNRVHDYAKFTCAGEILVLSVWAVCMYVFVSIYMEVTTAKILPNSLPHKILCSF